MRIIKQSQREYKETQKMRKMNFNSMSIQPLTSGEQSSDLLADKGQPVHSGMDNSLGN